MRRTQAHNDFIALFEHQLEQFVAGQSFTQEEFVAACEGLLVGSALCARDDLHALFDLLGHWKGQAFPQHPFRGV